jgi:hypothetical protein
MHQTEDFIAHAAIYNYSYEVFMLPFISGMDTQHSVLNCYVAILTSEEVYSVEGSELLSALSN